MIDNTNDTSTPPMSTESVKSKAMEEAIRYAEIGEYLYSACAYSHGDGYTEPREYGIEWQWQQSKPDEYGQGTLLAASTAWHNEQAADGSPTEATKLRAALSASNPAKEGGEAGVVERLKDAIEGECDGLAISDEQAAAILAHVALPEATAAPATQPGEAVREAVACFLAEGDSRSEVRCRHCNSTDDTIACHPGGGHDFDPTGETVWEFRESHVAALRAALSVPSPAGEAGAFHPLVLAELGRLKHQYAKDRPEGVELQRWAHAMDRALSGVIPEATAAPATQPADAVREALEAAADRAWVLAKSGATAGQIAHAVALTEPAPAGEVVEPVALLYEWTDRWGDTQQGLCFNTPADRVTKINDQPPRYIGGLYAHPAPEDTARLREDLEQAKRDRDMFSDWFKAEREEKLAIERDRDDARKALETVANSLDSALSDVRYQPGDHPVVPIKHDTFVGAVRLIASAARSASSQGGE